jgi:hypothetical protein
MFINAYSLIKNTKISYIFAEISEQILQFILYVFSFGEKIEELNLRVSPSQHPLFQ